MALVEKITDSKSFNSALSSSDYVVIHFATEWAEQCATVTAAMEELAKLPDVSKDGTRFYVFPAEDLSDISMAYKVIAVPTVILFKNKQAIDRVNGVNIAQLTSKVKQLTANGPLLPQGQDSEMQEKEPLNVRLKKLINNHKVMVFMKGSRNEPRCGFSKQLMKIFGDLDVSFGTFDILTDEEVRQGLKSYSDWPTYPQVYVDGELIGGLDIIKEMLESGELQTTLYISQTIKTLKDTHVTPN